MMSMLKQLIKEAIFEALVEFMNYGVAPAAEAEGEGNGNGKGPGEPQQNGGYMGFSLR